MILEIKDLYVEIEGKEILKGVNLEIGKRECAVLIGKNGCGKSTLALVVMGHPRYKITKGNIIFNGKSILNMSADERARLGLFLLMQSPPEIEGVKLNRFLQESWKSMHLGEEFNVINTNKILKEKIQKFGFDSEVLGRSVNLGFSGGEKKKSELFQLSLHDTNLAILDEFDSGLDVDSLKKSCEFLNLWMKEDERSLFLITHYSRVLEYVNADKVYVMINGKIAASGGKELIEKIENEGYDSVK
jgi:Fe-S cluster assembly ATP-binding protein